MCDIDSGMCELPLGEIDTSKAEIISSINKPVRVIYFTDPICSSCWGIEPQLRKLKLEYGNSIEFEYRMGGLLPDWSYNSGGISKPADVAHHWDEVSQHYDMPIDGDVWLEDPLSSSYPPSIAFKAAQMQDNEKAISFLREMREMLFLEKKNITKWEHLSAAAEYARLDVDQFKKDYEGTAKELFNEDLKLGKEFGVRGFPSLFFTDSSGNTEFVYGTKPYAVFENALLKLAGSAPKSDYVKTWESLFYKFKTLTNREYSELSGMPKNESMELLNDLTEKGILENRITKNGSMYKLKNRL